MEILIFRTNVNSPKAVKSLFPLLSAELKILNWTFDLEDCDKILRIEASDKISKIIIELLRSSSFECEELFYEL